MSESPASSLFLQAASVSIPLVGQYQPADKKEQTEIEYQWIPELQKLFQRTNRNTGTI